MFPRKNSKAGNPAIQWTENTFFDPSPVTVFRPRSAGPQDARALINHFQRLSVVDRYNRFFSPQSDDALQRYVETFDWTRMVATVVFSEDKLVGVAELGWGEKDAPQQAELALSVDLGFRYSGLATWLVSEVLQAGRRAGVQKIHASWLSGNDAIFKIIQGYGATISPSANHWIGSFCLTSEAPKRAQRSNVSTLLSPV
jgi:hypothetical protein